MFKEVKKIKINYEFKLISSWQVGEKNIINWKFYALTLSPYFLSVFCLSALRMIGTTVDCTSVKWNIKL